MELLKDPQNDRQIKSVKPPPHKPLSQQLMFPEKLKGKPDWKLLKDHLNKEGRIEKKSFVKLIDMANKIFKSEGNLLAVQDPVSVVGDIHGQYHDLIKILEIGGNPENQKYLFLGDFVDRGSFSIECIILLYSIKINFSSTVFFIRGNHECRQMTTFFNFRDECLYKYDQEIYDVLMESFDLIPLTCIVNGKFIATHGGISPDARTLDDIKKVDRFQEPPRQGLFCDLLWADPVENDEGKCDKTWKNNEVRGCSYFFGLQAVQKFLSNNNLISVLRAHEAQLEGNNSDFPQVITIFSAPNYCDVYNNKGAIIKFENNTLNIQQFNYTPHPYLLPNFMDIFTWSIPFVAEKVNDILYNILKPEENDDKDLDSKEQEQLEKIIKTAGVGAGAGAAVGGGAAAGNQQLSLAQRKEKLKAKIRFVSKLGQMQRTLRENREHIIKLKGYCPDNRIPAGLLSEGSLSIKNAVKKFSQAKELDIVNEKRPEFVEKNK